MKIDFDWAKQVDAAITICNNEFCIVYMNEKSIEEFGKYGGKDLIGQNLLDCHNPKSGEIIKELLVKDKSHSYTRITKSGKVKAIYQAPIKENNEIKGLVEMSFYLNE